MLAFIRDIETALKNIFHMFKKYEHIKDMKNMTHMSYSEWKEQCLMAYTDSRRLVGKAQ